mgnify:CR=1 FL=1
MQDREQFVTLFREIHPKFARFHIHILARIGLTLPQYALLDQLTTQDALSMTEIGRRLRITKPAVTHLVDHLEKKKCLKRVPHPKDRRIILLSIQPKGEKAVASMRTRFLEFLLKSFDLLNVQEQKTIRRFYKILSSNVDEFFKGEKYHEE